jgi:hypothetical protein
MQSIIPRLEDTAPDLLGFVRVVARQIEAGALRDGEALVLQMRGFYTAEQSSAIEVVAPGWKAMAAYADGATLYHVTQVLVALQLLPEYRQASRDMQVLMEWSALFHDLGKQVIAGQRDALHAFRSATLAARALPHLGFPTSAVYPATISAWSRLVLGASVATADGKGLIQDNRALPEILHGLEQMFGTDSAASLIVQAVLLHQSLNVVPEWPNPGSLPEAELAACIRPSLLPLLEALMLADSDAWQLFEPGSKRRYRDCTLAVFVAVRAAVGSSAASG